MSDNLSHINIDAVINNVKEPYGSIYKIPFPNGKHYIGLFTTSNKQRKGEHERYIKNGDERQLYKALRKYNMLDTFELIEIDTADDEEELCDKEIGYILMYNSHYIDGYGYNMTYGGEGTGGYVYTEEDKKKMSEIQKRRFEENPELGKIHSDKIRQYHIRNPKAGQIQGNKLRQKYYEDPIFILLKEQISNSLKTYYKNNPELSKQRSIREQERYINNPQLRIEKSEEKNKLYIDKPEIKEQISSSLIKYHAENPTAKFTLKTEEIKEKHMNSLRKVAEERAIKKMFKVTDMHDNFIGEWDYVPTCARVLFPNKKQNNIGLCLKGTIKSTGGYKFEYKTQ